LHIGRHVGNAGDHRGAEQLLGRDRVGEEGGRSRLLQRYVRAENRTVRGADDAQYLAMGVDHADRCLHPAVQRLANLRPGAAEDDECLFQNRAHFRRRERGGYRRPVGAAANREAVGTGAVGQNKGIAIGEFGCGRCPDAGSFRSVSSARDDRAVGIAGHWLQIPDGPVNRREIALQRSQVGDKHVAEPQRCAVYRYPVGGNRRGWRKTLNAGQRNGFLVIGVNIQDIGVEAIIAVRHDANAANHDTVFVQWQTAGVGCEAKRRAFRPDQGCRTTHCVESLRQVGAGELAELDTEQRPALQSHRGGGRGEMFLRDLAGRAAGKGIAAAGQIGTGYRLGDRRRRGWHHRSLQANGLARPGDPANLAGTHRHFARTFIRTIHVENRQHIADPVDDGDDGRKVAGLRFSSGLGNYLLYIGHRQGALQRRDKARRCRGGCRSRRGRGGAAKIIAASAAATGSQYQGCSGNSGCEKSFGHHRYSYLSDRIVRTALPSARRNFSGS